LSTIGIDFKVKVLHINDKIAKLSIWDTAGQERFRTITSSYNRGAHGIIFVYDVTNNASFEEVKNWLKNSSIHVGESCKRMLIGNKTDLEEKRVVEYYRAKEFADANGMNFMETSAKNATNIDSAFETLVIEIINSIHTSF